MMVNNALEKFNKILVYFFIVTVVLSLLSNVFISLTEENFSGIFSFRNIFLCLFLGCFVITNRYTLLVLIILTIYYWYLFFTIRILNGNLFYSSSHNHPILDFTYSLSNVLGVVSKPVGRTILVLPFFTHILISIIYIPFRVIRMRREGLKN